MPRIGPRTRIGWFQWRKTWVKSGRAGRCSSTSETNGATERRYRCVDQDWFLLLFAWQQGLAQFSFSFPSPPSPTLLSASLSQIPLLPLSLPPSLPPTPCPPPPPISFLSLFPCHNHPFCALFAPLFVSHSHKFSVTPPSSPNHSQITRDSVRQ